MSGAVSSVSRTTRPSSGKMSQSSSSKSRNMLGMALFLAVTLLCTPQVVMGRAILGVDLGSLYMKVALVQSGSPLEIVTNLHSKRKTEQMILFDGTKSKNQQQLQRFYGADAASLLARKSHQTPVAMNLLLGRDDVHPVVQVLAQRHYPVTAVYNETRSGVVMNVDGLLFTPEELVAMVLTHAVDISVAYAFEQGAKLAVPPQDLVLTVPIYATQRERLALLDAAELAGLNVLQLLDETTAAALQYAMDKTFVDPVAGNVSKDEYMLFYNMGASSLQVSLVHFFSYEQAQKYGKPKRVPAMTVLSKAWDETLGGETFDHLLVEYVADEFNKLWRAARHDQTLDVRTVQRAMIKIRLQANKVKHVLSANTETPIYMDNLHDDVSLHKDISRDMLESLATPMMHRVIQPVHDVLARANKTLQDLTGMELIGGGMRIPRIQTELSALLLKSAGKDADGNSTALELGLHMNADESMALGAAFCGANLSTAFRVRHVGMTDVYPFSFRVGLSDLNAAEKKEGEEVWSKEAVLFKALTKMGLKKSIAFSHDQDVACSLDYDETDPLLPKGTEPALIRYQITGVKDFAESMKAIGKPKVTLQFELSLSGIASLIKAEAAVEETYMDQEEIEVDDDEAAANETNTTEAETAADKKEDEKPVEADAAAKDGEAAKEGDAKNDTKKKADKKDDKNKTKAKPKKRILVEKEKKRVHKRTLQVAATYVGRVKPHTPEQIAASKAKLLQMAQIDKERMMLEESKNRVESYIYHIRNTVADKADQLAKVATEEQIEECRVLAEAAHEWMDDEGYTADYATMEAKYASLSVPFEKIMLRLKEKDARPAAIKSLKKKLDDVEQLLAKWETTKPQITEEERGEVKEKVEAIRKWIETKESEQAAKMPHEEPAFLSDEVPGQIKPVETLVVRLGKKPKPKPVKKESNATNATAGNASDAKENATAANETSKPDEPAKEGPKAEQSAEGASGEKTEGKVEDEL